MTLYTDAVDGGLEGLKDVSAGHSVMCNVCSAEEIDEGFFSWEDCDACGSSLGGMRYAAHGRQAGELIHLDVCEDCLQYIANGDEPEVWEG